MLKELKDVRQNAGDPFRRIFNGDQLSLILWCEDEIIVAFQINYKDWSNFR